jgi:hypothetical protein
MERFINAITGRWYPISIALAFVIPVGVSYALALAG